MKKIKETVKNTYDGFINVLKGLGSDKDARQYKSFVKGLRITQALANNLYTYNWLASKVVDIPVNDALRKWRIINISDAEKKEQFEQAEKDYGIKSKLSRALKWSRVFGGSAIIAIIEGQDPSEPLAVDDIQEGSLKNFVVLDRYNIHPGTINRDILSGNFGKPDYYMVSRKGKNIHHSRVLKFHGIIPTIMELEANNYWGVSVFTKMWEAISDSQITSQAIANLVYESSIDVYRIDGFNNLIANQKDELAIKRLKLASEMKSVINGIALDKNDEYEKKQLTFAGLPDIDDRFIQKVSGASNIPVTRLIGISPSGMNATGESDMYNYYDDVQALQENDIRPKLEWLDTIMSMSLFKDPEPIDFTFKALKQLTETEQAEVDLKKAQRDQIYLGENVIEPTDSMSSLAEAGTYPTIDEERVEQEKNAEELDPDFGDLD